METITSLQNARIKKWALLHKKKYRDETGLFLVEGEHLISEALAAGCAEAILFDEECPFAHEHLFRVTPAIMQKLSANVSDVHLIAVCRQLSHAMEAPKRLALLDGVQDPGNLGTIIRTAVSFSFDGVILSKDCADLYNEKTIRSTQGALFHIPVQRENLKEIIPALQKEGMQVCATALDSSVPLQSFEDCEKMAFVFGNEGQGVTPEVQKLSDRRVRIEMDGFESLNVAVAAGIVMYRFRG
jgi:TrmH family RNA methyltransferase